MSTSWNFVGYRFVDDEWKSMKAIWDACIGVGIQPPKEVLEFFDRVYPGHALGCEVGIHSAIRKLNGSNIEGLEIDVEALPPGVRYVRFYRSL